MSQPPGSTLLVERDQQLETLVGAAERGGGVVLVTGDAGAGKTSLLTAFRDRLDHRYRFRMGRCDPLSTPIPLAPLYEMLPTLPPAVSDELGSDGRRERVFRELFAALDSEPNVLVIDDAHWADQATVDLLRFLGRRIAATSALLVCAYRSGEVDRRHPLRVFLGELGVQAHRIEVPPLSFPAVAALTSDSGLDPHRVYSLTGGNPFLVTEMLADPAGELPASVADAVAARAATLPESAWQVLDAVALSPEGLELDLLEQLQAGAVQDADRGVAAGLLQIDGVRVRARHELVRRALEARFPPPGGWRCTAGCWSCWRRGPRAPPGWLPSPITPSRAATPVWQFGTRCRQPSGPGRWEPTGRRGLTWPTPCAFGR